MIRKLWSRASTSRLEVLFPRKSNLTKESYNLSVDSLSYDNQSRKQKPRTNRCDVTFDALIELFDLNSPLWLIDVREKRDVERDGMIPSSVNLPLSELKSALLADCEEFDRKYGFPKPEKHHDHLVFYSINHVKSGSAVEIAHRLGFVKARHYSGGYEDWIMRKVAEPCLRPEEK